MTLFESFLSEVSAPVAAPVAPFTVTQGATHKLTMRKGRAKNFRSIGNEFIEIDYMKNASTLITSDDNGAGKSTLMVWLPIFVLFNDTYSKREKKAGLVNSMSRKDCVAELEFFTKGDEWKVRRGIKPDFIEVSKLVGGEWKILENDAAKSDTNKLIQEIVGVDQKMFENAIVLGKEKYIPFSEMMTADRRLMVETIWDLGFFSIMNEDVKAAIKKIIAQLNATDQDKRMVDTELHGKYAQLEQAEAANEQLKQHSQDALDFAITVESQMTAEVEKAHADAELVDEVIDHLTDSAKTVREEVVNAAEPEVAALVESYQAPLAEREQQNEMDLQNAIVAKEDHGADKAGIAALQEKLKEEIERILENGKKLTNQYAEAHKNVKTGETFCTRFTTELEGHRASIQRFHDMGTCPTCTQLVSDDTKARISDEYQPKITELEANLAAAQARTEDLENQAEEFSLAVQKNQAEHALVFEQLSEVNFALREHETKSRELQRIIDDVKAQGDNALRGILRERDRRVVDLRAAIAHRANDAASAIDLQLLETKERRSQIIASLRDLHSKLDGHRTYMDDLRRKLAIEPTSTTELRKAIEDLEARSSQLSDIQVELDESRQDHEHLLFQLRDDQTKANIISLYLPFLNSKVNEYLEGLNMFLQVQMDDTFEIIMASPERKGQSIFSLSTGQRARLNIAITMALRDVANLKASVQCNILVFDEILENLSERGVQEAVMMLKNKFKGNNLFVISQREQEFQEYFENNIRYGLRNGVTTVIEKN